MSPETDVPHTMTNPETKIPLQRKKLFQEQRQQHFANWKISYWFSLNAPVFFQCQVSNRLNKTLLGSTITGCPDVYLRHKYKQYMYIKAWCYKRGDNPTPVILKFCRDKLNR